MQKLSKDQILGLVARDLNINKDVVKSIVTWYEAYSVENVINGYQTEFYEAFTLSPARFDAYMSIGNKIDYRQAGGYIGAVQGLNAYAASEGIKPKWESRQGVAIKRKAWFAAAVK